MNTESDQSQARESDAAMLARRERLLGPAYRLFYEHPVRLVRGEGVWLFDADGQMYLDVYNNVPSVGHCHPRVVQAITRQAAQLNTHTRYLHSAVLDYSEMLLATFPPELAQVMYTCTGSEANDLAIRVAKTFTGGTGVIVTEWAYHGVTESLAGMSPSLGSTVPQGPHVHTVPAPRGTAQSAELFADGVKAALRDMAVAGIRPAALIVDSIFSSDGIIADPAGFLRPAVAAIREAGGLFIADEVQPGFGRTGDFMWGFQRHEVVPDIVTLGKPMGNGYPVAAMVVKPPVLAPFGAQSRYFNTFGGSPVAMAAARAVLEVIRDEKLRENARDTGTYLRDRITSLAPLYPVMAKVRGAGLFIGVELTDPATGEPATHMTARLVNELRRRRVLISAAGPRANVLKVRPPLPFGRKESDVFVTALRASLDTVAAGADQDPRVAHD